MRGYHYSRVGKRRLSQQVYESQMRRTGRHYDSLAIAMRPFGGTRQLMYQGELLFPLIKEADMYGVTFYDIGQAEDVITDHNIFADWGLGIRWFSPIGPLRFEWGFPLNRDPLYHEPVVFEFSIGTPF